MSSDLGRVFNRQYNCLKQLDAIYGHKNGCEPCTPDAINNPKCPGYEPISLIAFAKNGRVIRVLEKEVVVE